MLQFRMVTKPGSLKALVLLAPGAASNSQHKSKTFRSHFVDDQK